MRRLWIGIAGGVAAAGALAAWWVLRPKPLGLAAPRVVLVAGDVTIDARHVHAGDPMIPGASVQTPGMSVACFSVRASRVCLGASTQARLGDLGSASARIDADRGTVVLRSAGDELSVVTPAGIVTVKDGAASVEINYADTVVRALAGSPTAQPGGRPAVTVAGAMSLRDGGKRPSVPQIETEETKISELASRWQGSAGGIIQVGGRAGRVEVNGDDVGFAPASLLLDEGPHTLVVRDGAREEKKETLELRAGQVVVRGN